MNIFGWLFENIIYKPQLNILQLLYNITGDIGVSIVLLATIVNLALWPLFAAAYVNGQKTKILQPKLKELQDTYKDNQQELLKQTMEFNKKHGVNNSSIFFVLFAQIFMASGLWSLTSDVSNGKTITGLYDWLFHYGTATFSTKAFGFVEIGQHATQYIWLPFLNLILSFLYGMYTFRWAPQPNIPAPKIQPLKKGEAAPALDPAAMQKTLEFQTIYFMPVFLFLINFNLTAGVNIYFITVSFMSLVRQVFLTNFYSGHTDNLIREIADSDPTSHDKNPHNNLEVTADPAQQAGLETPVVVLGKNAKKNSSKTQNKGKTKKPKK